jgi:hydroxyacylglutathione hydrolase
MFPIIVHQFTCLTDNYGVLIHDSESKQTASIDAPEAAPIKSALQERGWRLTHLFATHHHDDHIAGIVELKQEFNLRVYGPSHDTRPIPRIDQPLTGGDNFVFGSSEVSVIATPGHTRGHIAYYMPGEHLLFAGDTLFSLGCGRVFEGTMEQMWSSLDTLRRLPPETALYCGHEYTLANARFALTVDPGNAALRRRAEEVAQLREKSLPTLPSTIAGERATNPFLRPESPEIRSAIGMTDASDTEVFRELRERKNRS